MKKRAVAKFDFAQPLFRHLRMHKMQGAKTEAEGSILRSVTKAECRKQHSNLCIMTHRLFTLLLSTKGFDNPYNSPQTSKRSCKNTNDNKKTQFDDVVYYPLPVGSCNHFIGDELLYEEVSRPYSHQCISRHPSHILKTFGC